VSAIGYSYKDKGQRIKDKGQRIKDKVKSKKEKGKRDGFVYVMVAVFKKELKLV